MKIDLHIHTTYSDGMLSPTAIVDTALECGLDCIALTDHDNVLSHKIATDYVAEKGLNFLDKKINLFYNIRALCRSAIIWWM